MEVMEEMEEEERRRRKEDDKKSLAFRLEGVISLQQSEGFRWEVCDF